MAKNRRRGKRHMDPQMSALAEIEKEGLRQKKILYSAIAIVLWNEWDKKQTAIRRFFDTCSDVSKECGKDITKSMVQICEEETGIEIQNGNGKSWHDMIFLNAELDTGNMTKAKYISMRRQQVKWVAPLTMACLLVTLHRRYGFGAERCAHVYEQVNAVREQHEDVPRRMLTACRELTGIDIMEVISSEGREENSDEEH